MIVSPDGLLSHKSAINTHGPYIPHALEIKCPTPQPYKTPVKYSVPDRYIFHFMAEMRALDVNELFYLSWSPESTTVHKVHYDESLWSKISGEIERIYSGSGKDHQIRDHLVRKLSPCSQNSKKRMLNLCVKCHHV